MQPQRQTASWSTMQSVQHASIHPHNWLCMGWLTASQP